MIVAKLAALAAPAVPTASSLLHNKVGPRTMARFEAGMLLDSCSAATRLRWCIRKPRVNR